MTSRIAVIAALTLSLATPALAQTYRGPAVAPAPLGAPVDAYDGITTGSIGPAARVHEDYGWTVDSAKQGNANQQNFPVQQYGQTTGGPGF